MKRKIKLHQKTKSGFTIIESTLVTAFIAMLLIAITVISGQMSAIFQKGLTLRSVNSIGRELISELTTSINSAPSIDSTSLCNMFVGDSVRQQECINDGAFKYVYQDYAAEEKDDVSGETDNVQYYGLFCTGDYTYAWNTYYGIDKGQTLRIKYTRNNGRDTAYYPENPNDDPFKIIKFVDKTYRACESVVDNYSYRTEGNFTNGDAREIDMTTLSNGIPYDMPEPQDGFLKNSETDLDLYELVIFPVSQDIVTLRAFFSGTFILGTNNGDANIVRSGDYCDPSGNVDPNNPDDLTSGNIFDLGSKFNYCGINKFNFAARTAGSGI